MSKEIRKYGRGLERRQISYMLIHLIGEFGSEHSCKNGASTQANIHEACHCGRKVVCRGEKILRNKKINSRNRKLEDPDTPSKVVNMR